MSRENNFSFLLVGLILYLLTGPILEDYFPNSPLSAELILRLGFDLMLLVGVWSFRDSIEHIWIGWGLTIGAVILTLISLLIDSDIVDHILFLLFFVFCLMSLRLCFHEVVHGGEVNRNRLVGSICVYLLMGVSWGVLFYYLEALSPGSFKGVPLGSPDNTLQDFLYYSFVTLTTLGYGDISPTSPVAQTVSYLEAVAGAVYLAVLVAVLVGTFFAQVRDRSGVRPTGIIAKNVDTSSVDRTPGE